MFHDAHNLSVSSVFILNSEKISTMGLCVRLILVHNLYSLHLYILSSLLSC